MLTLIAAAFFAALGVLAIWCTRVAAEKDQKLKDVLEKVAADKAAQEKTDEVSETVVAARTRSGSYADERVSPTPLPDKYLRD